MEVERIGEMQAFLPHQFVEKLKDIGHHFLWVVRLLGENCLAAFDARHLKHVVDKAKKHLARCMDLV